MEDVLRSVAQLFAVFSWQMVEDGVYIIGGEGGGSGLYLEVQII